MQNRVPQIRILSQSSSEHPVNIITTETVPNGIFSSDRHQRSWWWRHLHKAVPYTLDDAYCWKHDRLLRFVIHMSSGCADKAIFSFCTCRVTSTGCHHIFRHTWAEKSHGGRQKKFIVAKRINDCLLGFHIAVLFIRNPLHSRRLGVDTRHHFRTLQQLLRPQSRLTSLKSSMQRV